MFYTKGTNHSSFNFSSWGWWPLLSLFIVAGLNYLVTTISSRHGPHREEEQLKRLIDIHEKLPVEAPTKPALEARIRLLTIKVATSNLRAEWAYTKGHGYLPRRIAIPSLLCTAAYFTMGVYAGVTQKWTAIVILWDIITGIAMAVIITLLLLDRKKYRELKSVKELWRHEEAMRLEALRPLLDQQ